MRKKALSLFILACVFSLTIMGCGSTPSLKSSERLATPVSKVTDFEFVYQKAEIRNSKTGLPYTYNGDGFFDFGQHLINESVPVFARASVRVVSGREIEPNRSIQLSDSKVTTTGNVLLVYASTGKVQSRSYADSASFVFEARLIDKASGRIVWQASVDTSSWNGKSFMRDSASNKLYNKEYASQLLTILSEAMKKDGVI